MRTAKEIYKDEIDSDWFSIYDYEPILSELGTIVIQVDDDNYQGDSRVLYKNQNRYGVLIFGWGSCSGCDALQDCDNISEVQDLMDELENDVNWFDNAQDCLTYFKTHDWEGDYSWHADETKQFINESIGFLENV